MLLFAIVSKDEAIKLYIFCVLNHRKCTLLCTRAVCIEDNMNFKGT